MLNVGEGSLKMRRLVSVCLWLGNMFRVAATTVVVVAYVSLRVELKMERE